MISTFQEIKPHIINDNVFQLIGADWMLITAGTRKGFNTMTANWGGLGYLWNRNVCFCFIRPPRYTYKFMERTDIFTLTFYEEKDRGILKLCGAKSGRDVDKIKETGLVPVFDDSGAIWFEQARLVLECKKVYFQDITPKNFLDSGIPPFYPKKDYHRMYIGEIIRCLKKK